MSHYLFIKIEKTHSCCVGVQVIEEATGLVFFGIETGEAK